MFCKKIYIENFRNISSAEVVFSSGTNIIVGDNAQGKTNLIESIYLTAIGRSFRAGGDLDLIKFSEGYSFVKNEYFDGLRDVNLSVRLIKEKKRKQIEHNGIKIQKMSEMMGNFRVVLFCPEHLSIVKDGPLMRRSYLDIAISQIKPLYVKSLQKYNSILKQRNMLIKTARHSIDNYNSTIDVWDMQLAQEAAQITKYRSEYLSYAKGYIKNCINDMTCGREDLGISYMSSCGIKEDDLQDIELCYNMYLKKFYSAREREIALGATLYGPHKDDMEIYLNGKNAKIYCSQGQQRSIALAMKISEGEIIKDLSGGDYPVFLLDDVMSELDGGRKNYLINNLFDKQVIMTSCESMSFEGANVIGVKKGEFIIHN